MNDIAIEVKDLTIRYKFLKSYSIKKNLLSFKRNQAEVFEALSRISFTVNKGDIVGIVGRNGSGKSTLLKAIGGIFSADSGTIDLHGNTVSLLSIGVGFQPKLSGRENIYLSGMLLGFTEAQIRTHVQEIIEFAELGNFIDKPVKTYSSGMHSKLAFSITAFLKTDIILIDEVLSVGDAKFREKSFAKMKELILDKERTVLIVSHSESTILELCDKALWINAGQMCSYGEAKQVMQEYNHFIRTA